MADATYGFRPSKLSEAEQKGRTQDMDRFWAFAQGHPGEAVPCLRQMLAEPRAGSYLPVDGAALLVKLDPSPSSKALQARLLTEASLEDVSPRTWVETLARLGRDGVDVSPAGRRWLSEPALGYSLPEHGAHQVDASAGAIFLFGSMDEAHALPALAEVARDLKRPGRPTAVWLLLFQATPQAREVLRATPVDGLPAEARTAVAAALAAPVPRATPYRTLPLFTRAELLAALDARERDQRRAFDELAAHPRFADSGAQVLLPADEPLVRRCW